MSGTKLMIDTNGNVHSLYTDLIDLSQLGKMKVSRASNVEFDNDTQTWSVKLASTGEVISPPEGFKTRPEALNFEVKYLQDRMN